MLCSTLWAAGQFHSVSAEQDSPIARQKAVLATVTASVEAINLTNREVTLKGPLGN